MASAAIQLTTPIQFIKGVGPARSKALSQVGIETVEDLLYYFPRRHLDRTSITACKDLKRNVNVTVVGIVKSCGMKTIRRGKLFQALIEDGTGFLKLTWFNGAAYVKKSVKIGDKLAIHGKVEFYQGFQVVHPEYDKLDTDSDPLSTGSVIPLYPLNQNLRDAGLAHRSLRKFIRNIQNQLDDVPDFYTEKFLHDRSLINRNDALNSIHFADDVTNLKKAIYRLKFDEHFFLQLGVAIKKETLDRIGTNPLDKTGAYAKLIYDQLDFELTIAQKRVLKEIHDDMKKPLMMNRLLQGDVGCGKTIIAILISAIAVGNKVQVAIMAPTEILAHQHYAVFKKYADITKITCALLVGNIKSKERKSILDGLKTGKINIIIGTHALIQKDVELKKLGLVIVDEQHRFGVLQRGDLVTKGHNPHFLAMTATPIPRTLSITYYGDMDLSVIDEMPKNRIPITTTVVLPTRLSKVYNFIKDEIKRGRQCMVVYPLVEETEKSDLAAAVEAHRELSEKIFPIQEVGLIHGRMKREEKDKVMDSFSNNNINILISTTVIEVGIDIPNATVMLVEHAERFGLTQLHQLRGRVGRSARKSYCILVQRKFSDLSDQRLKIMANTNDGFKIANEDLIMRGPGVFFGIQQSGFFKFKIANLISDGKILMDARSAAFALIKDDPSLEKPENENIKNHFQNHFQYLLNDVITA
ncbi:MAG: ATP-dependent DNA helicase RecG [Candidatus Neomarinimicrobiota bacterium]